MCVYVLNHYYSYSQKLFVGKFNIQRMDFQKHSKQTTKTEINIHFPRNELVVDFARQPTTKVRTGSTISDVQVNGANVFFFFLLPYRFLFNIIKICKHIRFSILLLFYVLLSVIHCDFMCNFKLVCILGFHYQHSWILFHLQ